MGEWENGRMGDLEKGRVGFKDSSELRCDVFILYRFGSAWRKRSAFPIPGYTAAELSRAEPGTEGTLPVCLWLHVLLFSLSPLLPFSHSPFLPFSHSPILLVSSSPSLLVSRSNSALRHQNNPQIDIPLQAIN